MLEQKKWTENAPLLVRQAIQAAKGSNLIYPLFFIIHVQSLAWKMQKVCKMSHGLHLDYHILRFLEVHLCVL